MANLSRHKCFISYHSEDTYYVEQFLTDFQGTFIRKAIGVLDENLVDSYDDDYVMRRIREDYLTDSTVTIVLIGKCTWSRKFIDWEIASTLRDDPNNKRSGLIGIILPYKGTEAILPDRFRDNWNNTHTNCYARYYTYPKSADSLEAWIEDAYNARETRKNTIVNSRQLARADQFCY